MRESLLSEDVVQPAYYAKILHGNTYSVHKTRRGSFGVHKNGIRLSGNFSTMSNAKLSILKMK